LIASLTWIVDADTAATVARLRCALAAGEVDAIDQVRAIWWLHWAQSIGAEVADLLEQLDPAGETPARPSAHELRGWLTVHSENEGRGALGALADAAGIHREEISKLRGGRPLPAAKLARLAAALIVHGRQKAGSVTSAPNEERPQQ
jgi:hypothetical protein